LLVEIRVGCQRCGTSLAELGWAACLDCLYAGADTRACVGGCELGDELGRGGMGVVYRAHHRELDREVAIKILGAELARDPALRARFAREAQLLARLAHPHIVGIFDAGATDDACYVVMELVDGAPITACEPARALRLMAQLCDALAVAHRAGIVHRDIKPSNVLVRGAHVTLVDFGIAALLDSTTMLTADGQRVGTPGFMAPEAWTGAPAHPAMDVYGAALLLRTITRGYVLPSHVDAVVERALAHDPRRRPTIVELRDALVPRTRRHAPRALRAAVAACAIMAVTRAELDHAGAASPPAAAVVPAITPVRAATPVSVSAPAPAPARAPAPAKPQRARPRPRLPSPVPPAAATLAIRATPWALVSIDSTPPIRAEPPVETISVTAGHHVVDASNTASQRRERIVVDLAPGETRTLTISLEKPQ